ncbi:MAG: STAS domain-containing protein [bacterium]
MTVTFSYYDEVVIVSTRKNLMGGKETEEFHQTVKDMISGNHAKIVADLSRVKWMNSKGLGALMACFTSCRKAGGDFKIAGATEKAKSLLMITKLLTIFDAFDTTEEAVRSFK